MEEREGGEDRNGETEKKRARQKKSKIATKKNNHTF